MQITKILLALLLAAAVPASSLLAYTPNNPNGAFLTLGSRPPQSTDDTTQGYSAGNFWNANGKQYIAQSVGAGTATWALQTPINTPICDTVTGASGCYGTYRMSQNYSGNAFIIQRSSDSTSITVPFDVNGIVEWDMVDSFCAGTTCGVSTWYDQSGNGYNLTQATFSVMPRIRTGVKVGNLRAVSFDGDQAFFLLTNSSLPITTRNTFTSLSLIAPVNSANQSVDQALFGLNSSASNWLLYGGGPSTAQLNVSPGSGNVGTGHMLFSMPQAFLTVNNAASLTVSQNNFVAAAVATGFSSTASTGLLLGGNGILGSYQGAMAGFVIYNSALSTANQQLLLQAAYRDSGIQPQGKVNIYNQASSLVCCGVFPVPTNLSLIGLLQSGFNDPVYMEATGFSGATLATLNSEQSTVLPLAYVPGMNNIFIPDGASNDMADSTSITAATVYSEVQTACANAHTAGFKCYVMSTFPRQGLFAGGQTASGFETLRQQLLALEKAGWPSFADGFIDPADDPVVGPQAATANTSYFASDQTHLVIPLGQAYEASIYMRGLKGAIQ